MSWPQSGMDGSAPKPRKASVAIVAEARRLDVVELALAEDGGPDGLRDDHREHGADYEDERRPRRPEGDDREERENDHRDGQHRVDDPHDHVVHEAPVVPGDEPDGGSGDG